MGHSRSKHLSEGHCSGHARGQLDTEKQEGGEVLDEEAVMESTVEEL